MKHWKLQKCGGDGVRGERARERIKCKMDGERALTELDGERALTELDGERALTELLSGASSGDRHKSGASSGELCKSYYRLLREREKCGPTD